MSRSRYGTAPAPQSESRTPCPHCGRAPGEQHRRYRPPGRVRRQMCPRAMRVQKGLAARLARLGQARWVHIAKGPLIVKGNRGADATRPTVAFNPGIPFVNTEKNGKPWFAGGVPKHVRADS